MFTLLPGCVGREKSLCLLLEVAFLWWANKAYSMSYHDSRLTYLMYIIPSASCGMVALEMLWWGWFGASLVVKFKPDALLGCSFWTLLLSTTFALLIGRFTKFLSFSLMLCCTSLLLNVGRSTVPCLRQDLRYSLQHFPLLPYSSTMCFSIFSNKNGFPTPRTRDFARVMTVLKIYGSHILLVGLRVFPFSNMGSEVLRKTARNSWPKKGVSIGSNI